MAKAKAFGGVGAVRTLILYVSPSGNDRWSGRLPEPDARRTDGPFATIERARNAVRKRRSSRGRSGTVRVLIRGGVYPLERTLVFGPQDSGTAESPVTYAAYPGERPVVSGGRRLSGWKVTKHKGKACWTLDLPEVKAGKWYFKQLFVDGLRRPRTRLPRSGFYRFADLPEGRRGLFSGAGSAAFAPGDIRPWKNLRDVEITALNHWFESHLPIRSVDTRKRVVRFAHRSLSDLTDEGGLPARYCLENVFEAMTEPGDWYLDRKAGRLYYLPFPGQTPADTAVVAPQLECLLSIKGDERGNKAHHIRFENLCFRHAEWNLPPGNPGAVQSAFNVPGAVVLWNAENCVLYGCEVSQISQYAIEVRLGCTRNQIVACTLRDMGAGGVKINHERPLHAGEKRITRLKCLTGMDPRRMGWGCVRKPVPYDDPSIPSSRTTVSDCAIHTGGLIYPSAIGVWIGDAGRNRVRHNHIYDLFYSGVSVGWSWGYHCTRTVDNRIEYNHIHDIGQGALSDMGAIYTLGHQPGTVLRGNVVHDVRSYGYGGWGFYTDEGSSFILLEGNVSYRTKCGGFHQHYGRDNVIRNNIFAMGWEAQIQGGRRFGVRPYIFERNLVCYVNGPAVEANMPNSLFDRNLYWRRGGGPMVFGGMTFEQWQRVGHDRNGRIADPLLADPESGNMALRKDSPAFDMGFRPIDTAKAGPRFRGGIPASFDDFPREREEPPVIVETRLEAGTLAEFKAAGEHHGQKVYNFIDPGGRAPACLMIRNVGETPVSGTIRLRVLPEGAGRIAGRHELAYRLKPGQGRAMDFEVMLAGDAMSATVESYSSGRGAVRSGLCFHRRARWTAPVLPGPARLDRVAALLAAHPAMPVREDGQTLAELRIGMAGSHLAVHASVRERRMTRSDMPWECSSVELFGATPGVKTIGRAFLLPAAGGKPDQGARMRRENAAACGRDIRVLSRRTRDGYTISALVPLRFLQIEPNAEEFLFEATVAVAPPGQGQSIRLSPFGFASNSDSSGFCRVERKRQVSVLDFP